MRRSAFQRLLAAAVLLSAGALLHGEQRVTQPYVGASYIDRTESAPRAVHMHITLS